MENNIRFQVSMPQNINIPLPMFLDLLERSLKHPTFSPVILQKLQPFFQPIKMEEEKKEKEKNLQQFVFDIQYFADEVGTENEKLLLAKMIKKFEKKYDLTSA